MSKAQTLIHTKQDLFTLLETISLSSTLVPAVPFIGPPNFHEVPNLALPPDLSILQHQLADLAVFTDTNKMKINHKKTKILLFDFSKKFNFLPQLGFPHHEPLEVIYETRLLGVTNTTKVS